MTATIADIYHRYLACLNAQDWPSLSQFVTSDVEHNGRSFGLAGYRAMLEDDFRQIPDLAFKLDLLIEDPPIIGARLAFDCRPAGLFLGLPVHGRRVSFTENVFYEFCGTRIARVWSVIDKAAIETQLQ